MKFQLCVLISLLAVGSIGSAQGPNGIWCPSILQGKAFIPNDVKVGDVLTNYFSDSSGFLSDKDNMFSKPFSLTSKKSLTTTAEFQNIVSGDMYEYELVSTANNIHPKYDLNQVFEKDKTKIEEITGLPIDQLKSVDSVQQLTFEGGFDGDYASTRSVTVYRLYHGQTLVGTIAQGALENRTSACTAGPSASIRPAVLKNHGGILTPAAAR